MGSLRSTKVDTAWEMFHFHTRTGYKTIPNYFKTSYAKGPQDGAQTNLKHKADVEVIKRKVVAKDLLTFTENNLKTPAPSPYQSENVQLKRQIFFCTEKFSRDCCGR